MQEVTVRAPASTSNLGPGFDCLGVALRIYNHVTVRRGAKSRLPAIVAEAAELFWQHVRCRPFPFSVLLAGDAPRSRGLGSSATVRVGLLHALNQLCAKPLDRTSIFELASRLEGHPDNAAPCVFGGFTVSRGKNVQRFDVSPRLHFVLLVPDYEVQTSAARRILPARIQRAPAVESSGNACAITAAFARRDYDNLRSSFVDHLHQPFRQKLNPLLTKVIAAADKAGALGAYLSGSGSTICAVTLQHRHRVAAAMLRAAGKSARVIITTADNCGVAIETRKSKIKDSSDVSPA